MLHRLLSQVLQQDWGRPCMPSGGEDGLREGEKDVSVVTPFDLGQSAAIWVASRRADISAAAAPAGQFTPAFRGIIQVDKRVPQATSPYDHFTTGCGGPERTCICDACTCEELRGSAISAPQW